MGRYKDHREPKRRGYDDDYAPDYTISERRPSNPRSSAPQVPVEATVKWFNAEKGFAFVTVAGGSDAFLHARALEVAGHSSVPEGARVEVRISQGQKRPQVTEVIDLDTKRRFSAAAISAMVAWVPFSSISRQRNARAIALTMALSIRPRAGGCGCKDPPDRRLISNGRSGVTIKIEPGQRVGRLIVVERAGIDGRGRRRWRCKCDCGNEVVATASQISGGSRRVRSCGCLAKERDQRGIANPNYKHGMSQTAEYQIWSSIIRRPRPTTVWPEWRNSFETFFRDVGPRPSPDMFLNRINNDQGYFPDNVRWASKCEQVRNQSRYQDAEISCEPNLAAGDD